MTEDEKRQMENYHKQFNEIQQNETCVHIRSVKANQLLSEMLPLQIKIASEEKENIPKEEHKRRKAFDKLIGGYIELLTATRKFNELFSYGESANDTTAHS